MYQVVAAVDAEDEAEEAEIVELASQLSAEDVQLFYQTALIGRRDLRSNNSWMHNAPRLMRGRNRCTLLVHRDDAALPGKGTHEGCFPTEVRARWPSGLPGVWKTCSAFAERFEGGSSPCSR